METKLAGIARASLHDYISPIAEIVAEAQAGRMFILVDDEDRENEGDLVIPAQFATPEAVNFMARHARGLICLAMTRARVEQLGLPPMARSNGSRHQTAFTVSIEARTGITTGISAHDRAHTIAVAVNPETRAADIVTPGHVFPLAARDGGTLIRAGHTEAAVDIARLAGLNPAGVICEVMNEDGSMARLADLAGFAQHHGLKLGTIADLIGYRRQKERLVRRVESRQVTHLESGPWTMIVYASTVDETEHMVLVKGDISGPEPVLTRVHALDFMLDMAGAPHASVLKRAMRMIEAAGRGVVVVIRDLAKTGLSERLRGFGDDPNRPDGFLRQYGIGAQILVDLGVREMVLLSDRPRTLVSVEGYGLSIVEQRPIDAAPAADRAEAPSSSRADASSLSRAEASSSSRASTPSSSRASAR